MIGSARWNARLGDRVDVACQRVVLRDAELHEPQPLAHNLGQGSAGAAWQLERIADPRDVASRQIVGEYEGHDEHAEERHLSEHLPSDPLDHGGRRRRGREGFERLDYRPGLVSFEPWISGRLETVRFSRISKLLPAAFAFSISRATRRS